MSFNDEKFILFCFGYVAVETTSYFIVVWMMAFYLSDL